MIVQTVSSETPSRASALQLPRHDAFILFALVLSLAVFYVGSHHLTTPLALIALAIFAVAAFLRPRLGLLLVPATVPLYMMPVSLSLAQFHFSRSFIFPLHEIALTLVVAAWFARGAWRLYAIEAQRPPGIVAGGALQRLQLALGWRDVPVILFLVASLIGLALAIVDAPALRELRWLVVEPLAFYGLARFYLSHPRFGSSYAMLLLGALLTGAALVAVVGVLQFAGFDPVPWLGVKQCACDDIMAYGAARRVLSVYGSPNNLALFLERVWPIGAALAVAWFRERASKGAASRYGFLYIIVTVLCALGILFSFSRGAWLGSAVGLAVLVVALAPKSGGWTAYLRNPRLVGGALAFVILSGAMLMLRNDSLADGSSVRVLLWHEAVGYIARHPLGLGLDQFLYYHDPESGRSLIAPALIGTTVASVSHPHNMILDTWLRIGPLGVIAMVWILVTFFRHAFAVLRVAPGDPLAVGALAAMAAALTHGLVDQFYFVPDLAICFWLLVALVEYRRRRLLSS